MADYTVIEARLGSIHKAAAILEQVRAIYRQCDAAKEALDLYTAGTDTVFNQAVDDIFLLSERQELNQMLTQIDALVTNWEANHGTLLGLP